MAEIINLRTARKRKARDQKTDQAAENRVKFGQTKTEKQKQSATKKQDSDRLDGHKLED